MTDTELRWRLIAYHSRIFTVGAALLAVIGAVFYAATLLPLWVVQTPLLLTMAYLLGKLVELWRRK